MLVGRYKPPRAPCLPSTCPNYVEMWYTCVKIVRYWTYRTELKSYKSEVKSDKKVYLKLKKKWWEFKKASKLWIYSTIKYIIKHLGKRVHKTCEKFEKGETPLITFIIVYRWAWGHKVSCFIFTFKLWLIKKITK